MWAMAADAKLLRIPARHGNSINAKAPASPQGEKIATGPSPSPWGTERPTHLDGCGLSALATLSQSIARQGVYNLCLLLTTNALNIDF
jgi:hypothetical protein